MTTLLTIWLKMIAIYNFFESRNLKFVTIFLCLIHAAVSYAGDETLCSSTNFAFSGLSRTNEAWLRDYLQIDQKKISKSSDLEELRVKLLTTDIFTSVEITIEKKIDKQCNVIIDLTEKWTRIPVIRGVYGGGTPLAILGGYETNAFGQLLAVGGELRRYGNMPLGGFLFFKSPRAWQGQGLWGGELWLDRRRRAFYDKEGILYGHADSETMAAKVQWLYPVAHESSLGSYQAGFHAQLSRESPTSFSAVDDYHGPKTGLPDSLLLSSKSDFGGVIGPMLAFDGLSVSGLNMSGTKGKIVVGGAKGSDGLGSFAESEIYSFVLLQKDVNFASHVFAGTTTQKTLGAVYYLGGFDSVRGLPDGIHYGNKTLYGNFEARVIASKLKYAHIQPAFFVDTGSAWMDGESPYRSRETSLGLGVRISIPQVYRLVLRIDYGVSVGHTKSRGFSIGLNQFFQPYKLVF